MSAEYKKIRETFVCVEGDADIRDNQVDSTKEGIICRDVFQLKVISIVIL